MRLSPKSCIPFLTLLLAASLTFSQTFGCRNRTVVVNVRDPQGRLVSELLPKNFEARFRGRPVKVIAANRQSASGRVVLLIDASTSISGNGHTWDIARMVAQDLIADANPEKKVAIVVFATKIVEELNFSASREQIFDLFKRMQDRNVVPAKGDRQTAFYDAVFHAVGLFGSPMVGDAIYAITDGSDNRSQASEEDVEKTLLDRGIRLFAFYLTQENFPTEEVRAGAMVLHSLVNLTGGAVLDIPNSGPAPLYDLSPKGRERMAAQLSYLYDLIAHSYQLEIELPASVEHRRRWDIKVVDDQGQEQKKLTLFYPQELQPQICF